MRLCSYLIIGILQCIPYVPDIHFDTDIFFQMIVLISSFIFRIIVGPTSNKMSCNAPASRLVDENLFSADWILKLHLIICVNNLGPICKQIVTLIDSLERRANPHN